MDEPGGRAVDADLARAAAAGDRVGLEAGAVVDVDDVHLLVLEDVGGLQQVGIDGDRAHVVQVAVGHRRTVDLGLEHHALHVSLAFPVGVGLSAGAFAPSTTLSISRTSPTRAATARSAPVCRRASGSSVSPSTSATYSGSTSARSSSPRTAARSAGAALSPSAASRSASLSPADRASARSRSEAESSALRLDIARPSGSRTVGSASIVTGRF